MDPVPKNHHIRWDEQNLDENEEWKKEAAQDPNRRWIEEPKTPYEYLPADGREGSENKNGVASSNVSLSDALAKLEGSSEPTVVEVEREKEEHDKDFENKRKEHYHVNSLKEALRKQYEGEEDSDDEDE
mmetsp:Transcript_5624/g.13107  ORF Transcript_5624/g.13107 Transcript_5624/m.13107 type:complete len:129 (+) Transcript_5624:73-459(+)